MQFIAGITGLLGAVFALGIFVADVLIAIAVYQDASARAKAGKKLMFLKPGCWSFVCLLTCLAGLALYWVIHYSTVSKIGDEEKSV